MAKAKLWLSNSATISRRIVLTGAAATTSALVLAACTGGGEVEGPAPTVTRVPAEGAPPTQPPAGATPEGGAATPEAGGATPEAGAATPEAGGAGTGTTAGPLIAVDIGWTLGDLSTLNGDEIVLTVNPGTTFEMPNEGAAEHDFTVDELSVHVPVGPGETVEVTIPADAAPGEYKFYCSVPGHEAVGMFGTLVVEEGGGGAAAPAGEDEEAADEEAASPEAAAGGGDSVGPLVAVDIGWKVGDLSTVNGDAITLTVSPGTTFDLVSEGAAEHDFVVDELSVEVHVAPGETVQVTIPEDAAAGEYVFYCSIPGHRSVGMEGTLVVQ